MQITGLRKLQEKPDAATGAPAKTSYKVYPAFEKHRATKLPGALVLLFSFTGNGFLYNMVRIMVGTLVEVGMGLRTPESVSALFGASRAEAGRLMSAQGLCLMEVTY
jgi:tRNA pseudouridine(38-40) synthase